MAESLDTTRIFAYLKQVAPVGPDADMRIEFSGEDSLLVRPFVEGVASFLVYDDGDSFRLLMQKDLRRLDLANSEMAFGIGIENLFKFATSDAVTWNRCGKASMTVIAGGNFEASFLLVPDIWPQIARALDARILVAAAPARDLLMVANDDPAGRAEVSEMLRMLVARTLDKPLTNAMLQWTGSSWKADTA